MLVNGIPLGETVGIAGSGSVRIHCGNGAVAQ